MLGGDVARRPRVIARKLGSCVSARSMLKSELSTHSSKLELAINESTIRFLGDL